MSIDTGRFYTTTMSESNRSPTPDKDPFSLKTRTIGGASNSCRIKWADVECNSTFYSTFCEHSMLAFHCNLCKIVQRNFFVTSKHQMITGHVKAARGEML
eukprot:TRINITY_DN12508_c0_g1_i1.p2 TRINITY_DN12508_c0_g1~~TRINITY_DN12508_c0_g1_i1.p2  ORF type:complete len:100 (+),score=4.99 TRINITY_DN12508_c0_g1_i1:358-657(+)